MADFCMLPYELPYLEGETEYELLWATELWFLNDETFEASLFFMVPWLYIITLFLLLTSRVCLLWSLIFLQGVPCSSHDSITFWTSRGIYKFGIAAFVWTESVLLCCVNCLLAVLEILTDLSLLMFMIILESDAVAANKGPLFIY